MRFSEYMYYFMYGGRLMEEIEDDHRKIRDAIDIRRNRQQDSVLLTISVAACNVERWIEPCLQSLADYRFLGRVEVFVIDDGGTDRTMEIAKIYANKIPGIFTLVHKENEGWGSTVMYSIHHAHGRYLRIVDGDDLVDTDALETELHILEQTNVDMIYTPHVEFREDDHGNLIERKECGWSDPELRQGAFPLDEVVDHMQLCMHNSAFRASILRQHVDLPGNCYYTDNNFMFEAVHHSKTVYLLPQYVYLYRKGRPGQSTSQENFRSHLKDYKEVVEEMVQYLGENRLIVRVETDTPTDRRLVLNLAGMVMDQFGRELCLGPNGKYGEDLRHFNELIHCISPLLINMKWKCKAMTIMLQFLGYRMTSYLVKEYNLFRKRY